MEIKFKNGFLYYENTPYENGLLLNSLLEFNTEDYNFEELENQDFYYNFFEQR
jgi:hypothetical protein